MIAAGEVVADVVAKKAKAVETVREAAASFHERRKAAGVVMAVDEERWLKDFALGDIGDLPVTAVRPRDIKMVLEKAFTNVRPSGPSSP